MTHEKIIKRDDGKRIKIIIIFLSDRTNDFFAYKANVLVCPPGKRKFVSVIDRDSIKYRGLNYEGRVALEKKQILEHLSPEELYSAKIKLWEKLKPTL